jgi:hypothetical protein
MNKKEILLKVVSVLAVLLGLASVAIGIFVRFIVNMDTRWFISRFGPNGEDVWRTYDKLYETTLPFVEAAGKRAIAFYVAVGLGLLIFGITCGLWVRDLRRSKNKKTDVL